LAFLAFPLVWNKLYFKGNLAFLLGIGVALLSYGWLHRRKGDRGAQGIMKGAVLCTLLYFTHGVAFLLLSLASLAACLGSPVRPRREIWKRVGLSLTPGFLLLLGFLCGKGGASIGMSHVLAKTTLSMGQWVGKVLRVKDLLWSFHPGEWEVARLWLMMACFLLLAGVSAWRRRFHHQLAWLVLSCLYFLSPLDLFPLVRPHERVFWFVVFFAPIAMKMPGKGSFGNAVLVTCSLCLFGFQSLQVGTIYGRLAERLEESRDMVKRLPEGKNLVSIWERAPSFGEIKYGAHLEAYYVVDRKGIVRSLFARPYQIVQYRGGAPIRSGRPALTASALVPFDFCLVWKGREPVDCETLKLGFAPFLSGREVILYKAVDSAKEIDKEGSS